MSQTSTLSTLHAILAKSKELKLLVGTPAITRPPPPPPPPTSFPHLSLPYPTEIFRQIEELPLPRTLVQQLRTKLSQLVSSLQTTFTARYHQTCRQLALLPEGPSSWDDVRKAYEGFYFHTQLPNFHLHIDRLRAMIERRRTPPRRVTFNAQSTPLLEKYFEQNAYPSSTDRALLAQKTGMTQRQIEVWFQNHRNRARKAGRPLSRPVSEGLVEHPARNPTPEAEPERNNISRSTVYDHLFNSSPAPATAFPSPFTLSCELRPMVFPKAEWARTPANSPPTRSSTSIKELCSLFSSKLRFPADSGKPKKRTSGASQDSWFSSRMTRIPKQHPAFLPFNAVTATQHHPSTTPPVPRFDNSDSLRPIRQPTSSVSNKASFSKYSKTSLGAPTPSLESISFDSPSPSSSDECPPTPPDGQDLLSLVHQDPFSADDLAAFLDDWLQQASMMTPDTFVGPDFAAGQDTTNENLFLPSDYSFVPTEPFIPQASFTSTFNPYLPLQPFPAAKPFSESSSLSQLSHPTLLPSDEPSYLPQPSLFDFPSPNDSSYLTQPSQPALSPSNDFSYLLQPSDPALQPPPNPFSNDFDFYSSFSLLGSSFDFPSDEVLDIQFALPDASHLGFI